MPKSTIPSSHLDLLQKKAFGHLATLMPNGQPQVTPVWFEYDGEHLLFNTAVGRQKDQNLQRDGRVTMTISDPENPYRYLEVRGRVAKRTQEGADASIDKLSHKYLGKNYPHRQPGEARVIYLIAPEHTTSMG